ncbi:hypothetical protein D9758_001697 [Tetrapyrgos nigripes]|uniref:Extradiol ring-cleavage dioxygenase class III enzyme subunit B domain-containing protein n=1 Tax=Tetrapyrgos nigripes TaxID=182062 RepID=A0A8H5LWZ9_9AGAR|nr:hypothetical protein D9758_001697 [Tetrapyrgos nigripes]
MPSFRQPLAFLSTMSSTSIPLNQEAWRAALASLPATPDNIPAFFFAHGSPVLAFPPGSSSGFSGLQSYQGADGPLYNFLKDFGPVLLEKYKPKAIVVFSAHWETMGERLVTDYGDENPLLMDYYGFPPELYKLKFKSRGDSAVSQRVVQLFKDAGYLARITNKLEPRGEDGRDGRGAPGLDHGVFVPFRVMFGEELDTPVIAASIDSRLTPESNWKLGEAVRALRKEGVLVLSGGLPIHNLRDFQAFHPDTAKPTHHAFHQATLDALAKPDPAARKQALYDLTKHEGFRACHPREDHFVPLYVAAGAGEEGEFRILNGLYGLVSFAVI